MCLARARHSNPVGGGAAVLFGPSAKRADCFVSIWVIAVFSSAQTRCAFECAQLGVKEERWVSTLRANTSILTDLQDM